MAISNTELLIVALVSLCGCASVQTESHVEIGSKPICAAGTDLGATRVLLKTEWRSDQKEPIERERMATDVIRAVFRDLPCGHLVEEQNTDAGAVDTRIEVTLREFGPELVLSIPVLWSSNTDVDATIRVTDVASGGLRFAISERRKEGGAFAVKSLSDVPATFESLLMDWIGKDDAGQRL